MAIQERAEEILDKLTQDVKIEDAAVMIAGFYAGMNGYTPLSAIMKMIVVSGNGDKNLQDAALRSVFGIPGLAVQSLFNIVTQAEKDDAALNNMIPMDRMDPRKITIDYLYERLIYLKNILRLKDTEIEAKQVEIDQLTLGLASYQSILDQFKAELAAGFPKMSRIMTLEGWIRDAINANQRLAAAIAEELRKAQPNAALLDTYQDAINDNMERIAQWQPELNSLLNEKVNWENNLKGQIAIQQNYVDNRILEISNKKQILQNFKDQVVGAAEEVVKIERKLLEIKLSLGMVGLIEAYTISRIGIGEILKGVGEIIPL